VVAEVGYLLGRAGDAPIEAAFLRTIVQETLTGVDLELVDYERMAELVEVYADFPLVPGKGGHSQVVLAGHPRPV